MKKINLSTVFYIIIMCMAFLVNTADAYWTGQKETTLEDKVIWEAQLELAKTALADQKKAVEDMEYLLQYGDNSPINFLSAADYATLRYCLDHNIPITESQEQKVAAYEAKQQELAAAKLSQKATEDLIAVIENEIRKDDATIALAESNLADAAELVILNQEINDAASAEITRLLDLYSNTSDCDERAILMQLVLDQMDIMIECGSNAEALAAIINRA